MSQRPTKYRLDQRLVDLGLAENRSRAQSLIMAGLVFVDGHRIDTSGHAGAADKPIEIKGQDHPWVSRGGLKLAHGIETFGVAVENKICIDVGASTGGFTDVLLQNGAAKVYAVDVGHGQLAWKLRSDERVIVLEKTNARHLSDAEIPEKVDVVVCDASFIGLATVLPAALGCVRPGGWCIALIKPQFEVGRSQVGKKGVVRDPELHMAVCNNTKNWFAETMDWLVQGVEKSPITGPEGNIEFLIAAHNVSPQIDAG